MEWNLVLLAREQPFLLILPTLKVGMFVELVFSSGFVTLTLLQVNNQAFPKSLVLGLLKYFF